MDFAIEIPVSRPEPDMRLIEGDVDTALREFVPAWTTSTFHDVEIQAGRAREVNRSEGADMLATYRSFRRGGPWGITIKRSGIYGIAGILHQTSSLKIEPKHLIKTAYRLLYAHERFHFQVDCAFLTLELSVNGLSNTFDPMHGYNLYDTKAAHFAGYDRLEEALANARALRYVNKELTKVGKGPDRKNLLPHIEDLLRNSPEGYRDFEVFSSKNKFFAGLDALVTPGTELHRTPLASGFSRLVDLNNSRINGGFVPTYIHFD